MISGGRCEHVKRPDVVLYLSSIITDSGTEAEDRQCLPGVQGCKNLNVGSVRSGLQPRTNYLGPLAAVASILGLISLV